MIPIWPNRDPLGGTKDFLFVSDDPCDQIDTLGLLQWVTDPTRWENTPMGGGLNLAFTIPDLSVVARCVQCSKFGTWFLAQITVHARATVHLETDSTYYTDMGINPALIRLGELDHVFDFLRWVKSAGIPLAKTLEESEKGKTFEDQSSCEAASAADVGEALDASLQQEVAASHKFWDTTGKHTYGGPNYSPGRRW